MAPRKKNYVNNADFTAAIVKYQKECKKANKAGETDPPMPTYIGECILQIANRLTRGFKFDFTNYTYRDEMVADAIERAVYAVRKFNAKKATAGAFSYMTTVCIHAMKKRINDEKKQNYTKHKSFQTQFILGDLEGMSPNEQSDRVIDEFEERVKRKAALTKPKKSVKKKIIRKKKKKKK